MWTALKLVFLNPWVLLVIAGIFAGSNLYSYSKGVSHGETAERAVCQKAKDKAAKTNVEIKTKQDFIRSRVPDSAGLIDRLLNGTYAR